MSFSDLSIILASASPRRRELMPLITKDFTVIPSNAEESVFGLSPAETVEKLSLIKAESISIKRPALIIGADTLVAFNGECLGKPSDEPDARRMLRLLSGNSNEVFTGVTVINTLTGDIFTAHERTLVFFSEMSDKDIDEYISTGEPMDKAGAYGIQGAAAKFIERIDGCYFNVMGLPVRLTYLLLKKAAGV